jgi:hypothetical protein
MTDAEWLSATAPERLLNWLQRSKRRRPTLRKLQLLANAFADRIADRFIDPVSIAVREFMERMAESHLSQDEYLVEWRKWQSALDTLEPHGHILAWAVRVSQPGIWVRFGAPEKQVLAVAGYVSSMLGAAEQAAQVEALRDIIPNPYRPATFSPSWRTSTDTALAQQMYESRNFSTLPILADAIQDAGCEMDDILNHCRGPGPHVRGCWVVDLVLGKE